MNRKVVRNVIKIILWMQWEFHLPLDIELVTLNDLLTQKTILSDVKGTCTSKETKFNVSTPFTHLDKELANLSDMLKQEQALSEQKGALNDETIDYELHVEVHCCMTFNAIDKELATLGEKFKQQQVVSEQKGTSNYCKSCK